MTTEDVQPSRLARATDKIHDLLKERGAAKTSLIAHAGVPMSSCRPRSDSGIIDTFARALDPKIMPWSAMWRRRPSSWRIRPWWIRRRVRFL